jgi:poly(3-hydroxybutyrate) depolymerase
MGGGGAGGSTPVMASAGCGKMSGKPTATSIPNTIVTFPDGYDGSQPMPLVFGFHGANRTNANFQTSDTRIGGSDLEKNFVMAYIKSTGSGWVVATDTARLDMAYTQLTQNYCIDVNRVYATGHSSGAQMIVQLLCNGEKRFKAVAPVAASKYCAKVSPIATLYIQGMRDAMRGNASGKDVVDVFASSNMCGSMTLAENVPTCNSSLDGAAVTPGCIAYQGCSAPLVWCSHNDNSYNATDGNMHGWPCFATKLIYDFFSKSK